MSAPSVCPVRIEISSVAKLRSYCEPYLICGKYSRQRDNSNTIHTEYNRGIDISRTHSNSLHVKPECLGRYHWNKHEENINPTRKENGL